VTLRSSVVKLVRAEQHLIELHRRIEAWMDDEPFTFEVTVYERERSPIGPVRYFSFAIARAKPVPDDLSTILGDFLHNIRGALDHFAWQIACRHLGRTPTVTEARRIYFPIADTYAEFRARPAVEKGLLGSIGSPQIRLIRRYQPYKRRSAAARDEFAVLAKLSNEDKHRAVHAVYAYGEDVEPRFVFSDCAEVAIRHQFHEPIAVGTHVAVVAAQPTGPHPAVNLDTFSVGIAFGEEPYVDYRGLRGIYRKATRLIGVEGAEVVRAIAS
jgi:hypothetical protein